MIWDISSFIFTNKVTYQIFNRRIRWIIRFSSEFYCWWCISTIRWVGKACYLKWRANAEKEIAKVIPEKSSLLSKCQSSRSRERAAWPSWRAPMTRPRTRRARPGTTPTSRQRQRCTPISLDAKTKTRKRTYKGATAHKGQEQNIFLDKGEDKEPRQGFVKKNP